MGALPCFETQSCGLLLSMRGQGGKHDRRPVRAAAPAHGRVHRHAEGTQPRRELTRVRHAKLVPMKARHARDARTLEDIPNIGPSIANDLRGIGIATPQALVRQDPYALYARVNAQTGQRHDPCVLDVLLAAHEFMNGGAAKPWWVFTAQRKAQWASRFKTAAKGLK